jgi:hypothetical protein
MNPTWPEINDWFDLLGNIWIGIVVVMVAAVPSWLAAKNHKSIRDIKDQVVNGHENPMRFDLDRAITAIESLAHDVRSLRKDLMAEEDHRRLQINDLRDELDHRTGRHRQH